MAKSQPSLAQASLEDADIIIVPDLTNIGAGDFQKTQEMIIQGEKAAQTAIPEIKRRLKNL